MRGKWLVAVDKRTESARLRIDLSRLITRRSLVQVTARVLTLDTGMEFCDDVAGSGGYRRPTLESDFITSFVTTTPKSADYCSLLKWETA